MACWSEVRAIGVFNGPKDFLSFLRFLEIPRVLDLDTGTNREPFPDVADAYLLLYEHEQRDNIDRLIGLTDRSLKAPMILKSELSAICDQFNISLEGTNPSVRILAWGNLADILASDHFEEAFEDAMEEETDEDEKPATVLRNLLGAGEFREGNDEHLDLAKNFLAQQVYA